MATKLQISPNGAVRESVARVFEISKRKLSRIPSAIGRYCNFSLRRPAIKLVGDNGAEGALRRSFRFAKPPSFLPLGVQSREKKKPLPRGTLTPNGAREEEEDFSGARETNGREGWKI